MFHVLFFPADVSRNSSGQFLIGHNGQRIPIQIVHEYLDRDNRRTYVINIKFGAVVRTFRGKIEPIGYGLFKIRKLVQVKYVSPFAKREVGTKLAKNRLGKNRKILRSKKPTMKVHVIGQHTIDISHECPLPELRIPHNPNELSSTARWRGQYVDKHESPITPIKEVPTEFRARKRIERRKFIFEPARKKKIIPTLTVGTQEQLLQSHSRQTESSLTYIPPSDGAVELILRCPKCQKPATKLIDARCPKCRK